MTYNPKIHNRKSIRLQGYDYSRAGLYFISFCVKARACLFGKIENGVMTLNELGNIANDFWLEIPKHYPQVELHEHVVMPNHIHGIIEITGAQTPTPVGTRHGVSEMGGRKGTSHGMSQLDSQQNGMSQQQRKYGKPIPGSVSTIINQYKSSVKRWCNKNNHEYFQWQSRFHDHIIRSAEEYQRISNYIINNPAKWTEDKFNSRRTIQ
jgi:putative transposase